MLIPSEGVMKYMRFNMTFGSYDVVAGVPSEELWDRQILNNRNTLWYEEKCVPI